MDYEKKIGSELAVWEQKMLRRPGYFNKIAKGIQDKINGWIPEKVHTGITVTLKQMIRAVLFGASATTPERRKGEDMEDCDRIAEEKIRFYQKTAATEGAVTGAGGILLGIADFPILLAMKIKLLYEIAGVYGYPTKDYKERLYLLHIFQLAFSSDRKRQEVFLQMKGWDEKSKYLPEDINEFDWRNFQQEYRDYIDLAKMAQLVPVIGAPVGAIANYQLIRKLGNTAKRAYQMRWKEQLEVMVAKMHTDRKHSG